jgi:hypothetical protein
VSIKQLYDTLVSALKIVAITGNCDLQTGLSSATDMIILRVRAFGELSKSLRWGLFVSAYVFVCSGYFYFVKTDYQLFY